VPRKHGVLNAMEKSGLAALYVSSILLAQACTDCPGRRTSRRIVAVPAASCILRLMSASDEA